MRRAGGDIPDHILTNPGIDILTLLSFQESLIYQTLDALHLEQKIHRVRLGVVREEERNKLKSEVEQLLTGFDRSVCGRDLQPRRRCRNGFCSTRKSGPRGIGRCNDGWRRSRLFRVDRCFTTSLRDIHHPSLFPNQQVVLFSQLGRQVPDVFVAP